ncbi:MAG: glycosyltransferase family 39 protein, partial [Candidatus Accumulibacter sp.]|nr:glycosyltransferase family 39 protein [Accumulibacter sp.]
MKSGASATMTAEQSRSGIRSHVALGVLVLAIILIHAAGLRTGHEWSDDYAMYLSHALNLLSGQAYGDTGYIPNPWAVPGPATYPPVYPLLIMPWVAWWGTDLQMLKLFGLLMLAAALLTGYALLRPRIGSTAALLGVAILGLNPFFLEFRDEIRPDTTFLFFFLLTLWIGDRWTGKAQAIDRTRIAQGLLLGLVAYCAYGTRSVGIVLLPALALLELWRLRR